MSDKEKNGKWEIYFSDFTNSAQMRILDFDPDFPKELATNQKPMITMAMDNKTQANKIDLLAQMLLGRIKGGLDSDQAKKEMPPGVMEEAIARINKGEDVGGIIVNKATGEYKFLTDKESKEEEAFGGGGIHHVDVDVNVGKDDCDCPECRARRAGMKADPRKWN